MDSFSLLEAFRKISPDEWAKFGQFVESQYFNSNQTLINLYSFLSEFHPAFLDEELTLSRLNSNIYGDPSTDIKKTHRLMYKLKQLFEQFLLIENVLSAKEGDKAFYENTHHILRFYRQRGLIDQFEKLTIKQEKYLQSKTVFGVDELFATYRLELEKNVLQGLYGDTWKNDVNYSQVLDALEKFYLIEKLKWSCLVINRQRVLEKSFSDTINERTQAFLEKQSGVTAQLETWYAAYKMFVSNSGLAYKEFRLIFFKNMNFHSRDDQRLLFTFLINEAKHYSETEKAY